MRLMLLNTTLVLIWFIPAAHAQETSQPNTPADFWNYDVKQKVPEKAPSPVPVPASITHHQISLNGQKLSYTATADTLPIRNATTGVTEGEIFYIYYKSDEARAEASRPLVFVFNGGPGTASVWLHMVGFGPKRIHLGPDGSAPDAPYGYDDNLNTLLDQADLVFIDPVGTGYSRPSDPSQASKFWGMKNDVASIGEFVRLFLVRYDRWLSPRYVLGESYGTYRAAELANYLVERGITLNGVILISSLFQDDTRAGDFGYVNFIPTFSLVAWYHKRLPPDLQKLSVEQIAKEAEKFASGEYMNALYEGTRLPASEREKVADDLARFTGLSKQFIENNDLRVSLPRFMTELLRDKGMMIGRLDGRQTAWLPDEASLQPSFDAANQKVYNSVVPAFEDYAHRELGYKSDALYYVSGGGIGAWPGVREAAPDVEDAFARNPKMRLFVAEGYFDLATIYYGFEWSLSHLRLAPEVRGRDITVRRYRSGHMIYTDQKALEELRQDLRGWLQSANERSGG